MLTSKCRLQLQALQPVLLRSGLLRNHRSLQSEVEVEVEVRTPRRRTSDSETQLRGRPGRGVVTDYDTHYGPHFDFYFYFVLKLATSENIACNLACNRLATGACSESVLDTSGMCLFCHRSITGEMSLEKTRSECMCEGANPAR